MVGLIAALGACLICSPDSFAASRGTAGADFLKIANGVRAVSMGCSYAAVGEDIYSLFWNPAGIANLEAPELVVSPVRLFDHEDIAGAYLFTAAVEIPEYPFGSGNMAAGVTALVTGSFDSTDPEAVVRAAPGQASDQLFFLTYGSSMSDAIKVGATIKFVRRVLTGEDPNDPASYTTDPFTGELIPTGGKDFSAAGVGLDVGALWENLDRTIAIGAAVQNIGQIGDFTESSFSPSFGEGAEMLPTQVRLGGAMRTMLWGQNLLSTADISSYVETIDTPRIALGMEYGLFDVAFFRLGWEQPLASAFGRSALDFGSRSGLSSLPSPFRGGIGVRWPVGKATMLQFDYAMAPFGTLGVVHQAAMLLRWNIPKVRKAITAKAPVKVERKKTVKPVLVIEPKKIKFEQPVKEWKVEITDAKGKVVKTFEGTGLPPKSLDWDGTNERGKIMTDVSKFNFVLKAKDVTDKEVKSVSRIASVSAEPQLKAVAGKPLYPEVVFVLPQGNYQLWQVKIQDAGRLVRTWEGTGRPGAKITWDGKDLEGQRTNLEKPHFAWQFVGKDGQKSSGEKPLPQIEAAVQAEPELARNRVRLVGVRFKGRATAITEEHLAVLKKASGFIRKHPHSTLTIESYSDASGTDEVNFDLAKRRADRVLQLLTTSYRMKADRVSVRIYGRSRKAPTYPNLPEEDQKQRVDLVINVRR